jgi:hypothetical protein
LRDAVARVAFLETDPKLGQIVDYKEGVPQSCVRRLDLGSVRRWSSHLAAIAVLLALSVLQCRSLLGALTSSVPANHFSGDDGQGVWYMAWLPFALGHGLDPFISHLQFAPVGFNLLSNTGMLFPALLLSPITVAAGPVVAFDVGLLAAPVVSGGCVYFVCRRLGARWAGGLVAGILFGFSPYLMDEAPFGHFNLTWLFFPPLAYYRDVGDVGRGGAAAGVRAGDGGSCRVIVACRVVWRSTGRLASAGGSGSQKHSAR